MNRWEYLITEEFCIRHHIAEYFLQKCGVAIDVGSYKKKLNFTGQLFCIDPLKTISDGFHGSLYEWYKIYQSTITGTKYGVVCLGLDLEGSIKEFNTLCELISYSHISILEYPTEYSESVYQIKALKDIVTNKVVSHEFDIKYPQVKTEGFKPFAQRKMIILV